MSEEVACFILIVITFIIKKIIGIAYVLSCQSNLACLENRGHSKTVIAIVIIVMMKETPTDVNKESIVIYDS